MQAAIDNNSSRWQAAATGGSRQRQPAAAGSGNRRQAVAAGSGNRQRQPAAVGNHDLWLRMRAVRIHQWIGEPWHKRTSESHTVYRLRALSMAILLIGFLMITNKSFNDTVKTVILLTSHLLVFQSSGSSVDSPFTLPFTFTRYVNWYQIRDNWFCFCED